MQKKIFYCSQNKLHSCIVDTQAPELLIRDQILSSPAVERFLRNSHEADTRDDWKTDKKGEDTMYRFLLRQQHMENPAYHYAFTGITSAPNEATSFFYSVSLGEISSGIYQQFSDSREPERIILSDNTCQIEDITFDGQNFYASVREKESLEAHIAVISLEKPGVTYLTDGDCMDSNPAVSLTRPETLYYVTSGFGRTSDGELAGRGPQYISRLSLSTMEQEEILCDDHTDYWKPKEDLQGNLYYLKRPYIMDAPRENPLVTIAAAPFRLLKAIGGALNYFTIRYSGKPLQSGDANPAKAKQKKQQDLFIEGNFIQAEKEYQKNLRAKETYPGLIPKNWELCCRKANGETLPVLRGVCDYDLLPDGSILYANGNHLLYHSTDGKDRLLLKTDLPSRIHVIS